MDKIIKSNYVLCDDCEKMLIEEWEKINGTEMSEEDIYIVPKNAFDMKSVKDKILELEIRHDGIVNAVKGYVDKYYKYREMQKELLKSKLPALVLRVCNHTNVEWDKNRCEGGSAGFWICSDCDEIVGRNYWLTEANGGWVTRNESKVIDTIAEAFFKEYPDIDTDICHNNE